jgi:hypothetical protein
MLSLRGFFRRYQPRIAADRLFVAGGSQVYAFAF